jgi:2,4-dienoyl-CoA reductase-like NADH-dependent reductase (Old Yellow Enzyme family)/NADPH-dependent 2,4-dienoyl-CoA reductase/sulfur reductase-like enzyme
MEIRNRIAMSPAATNLASLHGGATPSLINHYSLRARGGVGLIITEDTTIGPQYLWRNLSLRDDRLIPEWRELVEAVHSFGAKIAPQLIHPSFNARSTLTGVQSVAASPIPSRVYREIPKELTIDEIREIINQFGEAARRAQVAGCDAVQLHCAHCHHLLASFLSPLHNKRADPYGGNVEGRLRLPLEVIRHVRSVVGPDFPIMIRISAAEPEPGGRGIEETLYAAPLMVEAGVDAFLISSGTTANTPWITSPPMGSPLAPNAPLTEAVKRVVKVPIICVGRITNCWIAEQVLASGKADMVGMARALLADPEFPNKAHQGDWDDIRPCVGDMACLVSVGMDKRVCCLINPDVGRDDAGSPPSAETPKEVLVIGGGPSGLAAAVAAAKRKHRVTLMEKGPKLGGQLLIASVPPLKQELTQAVQYLVSQAIKAGVTLKVGNEATPEEVRRLKPDVVILATGGAPVIPKEIPGSDGKNVVTAWDVLTGQVLAGPRILVLGGGVVGCETADFLADPVDDLRPGGNRVTVIEMLENVALDERSSWRSLLIQRLRAKGVGIITGARVVEILPDGVKYIQEGLEKAIRGMDTIVVAMGTARNDALVERLRGVSRYLLVVGDAKEPRRALEAIAEGTEMGRTI